MGCRLPHIRVSLWHVPPGSEAGDARDAVVSRGVSAAMTLPITVAYGGGRQSAAMAVLIRTGRLPRPECIVMADTGREASRTWDYLAAYIQPMLAEIGLSVEVAPHELATVDLYGKNGDLLLPAFTQTGKLPTLCSNEWKKRVCQRYLRSVGYGPDNPCVTWLGISTDEIERMKPSGVQWQTYHWPLAWDLRLSAHNCQQLVLDYGLPLPDISSCWMCPHRQNREWRLLRDEYPGDWNKAVMVDEQINESHGVRLHRDGVALADVDLSVSERPGLFDG